MTYQISGVLQLLLLAALATELPMDLWIWNLIWPPLVTWQ